MLNPNFAALSQEELVQLGMQAARSGDAGDALAFFKEAAGRPDASALACHALGAHYAQLRLYEQAVVAMQRGLQLAPQLHAARVQLGLLHLTMGSVEQARQVLQALTSVADQQPYPAFAAGLLALSEDRLTEALVLLRQGIVHGGAGTLLDEDMARLADAIAQALEQADAASGSDAETPHLLLSAYGGYRH